MIVRIILTTLIALSLTPLLAQSYVIDAGHSLVQSQVERFGVVDVYGRFTELSGSIFYDDAAPESTRAQVTIMVNSYDANNLGGEEAVKSPVFLDAAQFPEIKFESTSVRVADGKTYLIGNLTLHGVTKQIEFPFTIKGPLLDLPTQKQSVAFSAQLVINRQDYGIAFDRKLPNGTPLVGNEVTISLRMLAISE